MFRIGTGYDVHKFEQGLPMVLGGVSIPHTHGFVAHSDGDVLVHALCDALLGALALGDIGRHFSDQDPQYKGIDSCVLLGKVIELVAERGYRVGNVDCTVVAQAPKLAPYVLAMRTQLARVMGVGVDRVSVKATTTEGLGFEGRVEGVSVQCVVLLKKI